MPPPAYWSRLSTEKDFSTMRIFIHNHYGRSGFFFDLLGFAQRFDCRDRKKTKEKNIFLFRTVLFYSCLLIRQSGDQKIERYGSPDQINRPWVVLLYNKGYFYIPSCTHYTKSWFTYEWCRRTPEETHAIYWGLGDSDVSGYFFSELLIMSGNWQKKRLVCTIRRR